MRIIGFIISLILLPSFTHAQPKHFFVDVGVSSGMSDYGSNLQSRETRLPAWSIKIGRESSVNPSLNFLWGLQYSLLADRGTRLYAYEGIYEGRVILLPAVQKTKMTQHFVALGMLLELNARHFKLLAGLQLGRLVNARFDVKGFDTNAKTMNGIDIHDLFARNNMMFSVGIGKGWRIGKEELYAHLLASQTISSIGGGRQYLAGFNHEYILRTGVRF